MASPLWPPSGPRAASRPWPRRLGFCHECRRLAQRTYRSEGRTRSPLSCTASGDCKESRSCLSEVGRRSNSRRPAIGHVPVGEPALIDVLLRRLEQPHRIVRACKGRVTSRRSTGSLNFTIICVGVEQFDDIVLRRQAIGVSGISSRSLRRCAFPVPIRGGTRARRTYASRERCGRQRRPTSCLHST